MIFPIYPDKLYKALRKHSEKFRSNPQNALKQAHISFFYLKHEEISGKNGVESFISRKNMKMDLNF